MKIQEVPLWFQQSDRHPYPSDNWQDMETWLFYNCSDIVTERTYLPILWTSYFKNNNYGKNVWAIDRLQKFIDSLPNDVSYWTAVQFDDGTLIDWKDKDVLIFGMSGKPDNCIPVPLVCQPHKFEFNNQRDILVSFVGRITDDIRKKIINWHRSSARMHDPKFYITNEPHSLKEYCDTLSRSRFVLCPRGYGNSSFRIAECYQYGAEPIIMNRADDKIFECPVSSIVICDPFDGDAILYFVYRAESWLNKYSMDHGKYLYSFQGVKDIIKKTLCDIQ